MHRILAILALVIITCFVSVGNNSNTSADFNDQQIILTSCIIEQSHELNSVSVANILPDGGSTNAMKDIIR